MIFNGRITGLSFGVIKELSYCKFITSYRVLRVVVIANLYELFFLGVVFCCELSCYALFSLPNSKTV